MRRFQYLAALLTTLAVLLAAGDAAAWGEKARQTAAAMAMQVIKGPHPDVFRPGNENHEQDVLRGATDGASVLESSVPLNSDAQTVQAIGNEIQLLRDAKDFGRGPYFAYRMGVLSSLVADVMVPFGFAWTPDELALQKRIENDTEARLESYGYTMSQRNREFIRSPKSYFAAHRSFYADDKRIIANDYRGGKGYSGFLRDGGPAYFSRSVDAIADAWHTVLRVQDDPSMLEASRRALAWYFVDQIAYLLEEKRDFRASLYAYENFERVNMDMPEAYDRMGDLYYAFGKEDATSKAVREWRIAYELGGPERRSIAGKLANHFMMLGDEYLARAESSVAEPNDLETGLEYYQQMMELDRTSDVAAAKIHKTHKLIQERNERYELNLTLISEAEKLEAEAETAKLRGDYSNAIGTYQQSITALDAVSDEFKDLFKTAQDKIDNTGRNISDIVSDILDLASTAIDNGINLREEQRYAEAIAEFEKVNAIVTAIPSKEDNIEGRGSVDDNQITEKEDLIKLAANSIDDAKKAKIRYEQAQQQAAAGGGGPGGPRPGGPAPGGPAPGN